MKKALSLQPVYRLYSFTSSRELIHWCQYAYKDSVLAGVMITLFNILNGESTQPYKLILSFKFCRFDKCQLACSNILLSWLICSHTGAVETWTDFITVLTVQAVFSEGPKIRLCEYSLIIQVIIRNCGRLSVEVWWKTLNLIGSTEVCVDAAVVWQKARDAPRREKTGKDAIPKILMLHLSTAVIR